MSSCCEGLKQLHPARGYVLKLINQHVPVVLLPPAFAKVVSGSVYHAMKIDLPFGPEPIFVSGTHLFEDIEEWPVAPQCALLTGTGAQLLG